MTMPAPVSQMRLYQDWLRDARGLSFDSYDALWRWSVDDLEAFWRSIWDYHQMTSPTPFSRAVSGDQMPGAKWFEGAQANYAQQVLRHVDAATGAGQPAIIAQNELGEVCELSWLELRRQVAALALGLRDLGVDRGDRVVAYLPNGPEAIVAMLACASLGAIWSICAPDMGSPAVIDRFQQIAPKVLIAADGVHYAGKAMDRSATVAALRAALPTVESLVLLRTPFATEQIPATRTFADIIARNGSDVDAFAPEWLPFEHPLWILYSSGTTGLPKPIVHSHGGVILAALAGGKHGDLGPSYEANTFGERYHWYPNARSWSLS
jgi:acetoacetyl-CoA synthetase